LKDMYVLGNPINATDPTGHYCNGLGHAYAYHQCVLAWHGEGQYAKNWHGTKTTTTTDNYDRAGSICYYCYYSGVTANLGGNAYSSNGLITTPAIYYLYSGTYPSTPTPAVPVATPTYPYATPTMTGTPPNKPPATSTPWPTLTSTSTSTPTPMVGWGAMPNSGQNIFATAVAGCGQDPSCFYNAAATAASYSNRSAEGSGAEPEDLNPAGNKIRLDRRKRSRGETASRP